MQVIKLLQNKRQQQDLCLQISNGQLTSIRPKILEAAGFVVVELLLWQYPPDVL
jgi:hypothetical protein